jgi:hypothetical protein
VKHAKWSFAASWLARGRQRTLQFLVDPNRDGHRAIANTQSAGRCASRCVTHTALTCTPWSLVMAEQATPAGPSVRTSERPTAQIEGYEADADRLRSVKGAVVSRKTGDTQSARKWHDGRGEIVLDNARRRSRAWPGSRNAIDWRLRLWRPEMVMRRVAGVLVFCGLMICSGCGVGQPRTKMTNMTFNGSVGSATSPSVIRDVDMVNVSFQGEELTNVTFLRVHMTRVSFRGVKMTNVTFQETDASGADFRDTDMRSGITLTQCNLEGAQYNSRTQFPPGVNPSRHGMVRVD